MRIAQVSPLIESVPPRVYGGTERVVHYLTEELVRQGHQVTLFASGDSETSAELVPLAEKALRLDGRWRDPLAHHVRLVDAVARRADEFDVIHFHTDYVHFPLLRTLETPSVTTLHGRLDLPDLKPLFEHFHDVPVVSISNSQRRPLPMANWQATVYNGLPADLYRFVPKGGDYLAFLGRMSPEKGPERAIRIAQAAGRELVMAAKVDAVDRDYFDTVIRPLLKDPRVHFLGEVTDAEKQELLGNALALVFPIDWPEPFGLVMIEAMACGTPVVAWPHGAVPEVLADGKTGFIVDSIADAAAAVERCRDLDRAACRRRFEERFSARRMARDYAAVYRRLAAAPAVPAARAMEMVS